jgi:hypothetical protein
MKNQKQKGKARKSKEVVKLKPILIKGGLAKKKKSNGKIVKVALKVKEEIPESFVKAVQNGIQLTPE